MKFFRRWLNRLITSLPQTQTLFRRADRAIEEATLIKQASGIEKVFAQEIELQQSSLRARMNEILMLRAAEAACYNPTAVKAFHESNRSPAENETQFKERLWELELALEDRGWVREVALSALEFSLYGVQQLIRITRIMAIKNPLIKRGAEIVAMYVFGRGIEIRSEDEAANAVVQAFLTGNKKELGHTGLAQKERAMQTDGALYWSLPDDGKGGIKITMVDPLEIMDCITDPDDTSCPRYFLRRWTRWDNATTISPETQNCWYPAMEYLMSGPVDKPTTIQGNPVNWEIPIFRTSAGACPPNWRWPIPPLYAAIDWAGSYKGFLEDWATVQRTLSRFALMIETKGGAGAIAAYNALLNTTLFNAQGTQTERNPPPVTGSAHISGPGNDVKAFKSAGASTAPEQARRLLLMVAAAEGLPETFFGDASTGSLATAVSLDRPTELKFREIQARWTDILIQILTYVLWVARATPGNEMRKVRIAQNTQADYQIVVKFPAVLEHDPAAMVDAWAHVGTLGGRTGILAGVVDRRTIADGMLGEIGLENRDKALDDMGYGAGYDPAADIEDQRDKVAPQQLTQDPTGGTPPPAKSTAKEAADLLAAVERLHESMNGTSRRH